MFFFFFIIICCQEVCLLEEEISPFFYYIKIKEKKVNKSKHKNPMGVNFQKKKNYLFNLQKNKQAVISIFQMIFKPSRN